jgi:hypothetical protein
MKNNEAIWKGIGDESTQDNALVRALKLGLDVHYRQVTVAMQEDGGRIKAAGKMIHGAFLGWVCTKLEEGWRIDSCYEAGASGYWLHRELVELGFRNLVVAPKAMGAAEAKRQKTDKRDSAQLCDALDRYLRGQDKALSVVATQVWALLLEIYDLFRLQNLIGFGGGFGAYLHAAMKLERIPAQDTEVVAALVR